MTLLAPDYYAPAFALYVETTELQDDITGDVASCAFEHTVDMVSKLSVTLANPDNRYTDSAVFEPGNELELHLGYGTQLGYVGRAELIRHVPQYPAGDTVPTIDVVGYDLSWRLGEQEMEIAGGKSKHPRKAALESGRLHLGTIGSVVAKILGEYGLVPDVHPLLAARPAKFVQKKGVTDLQVMRALANLNDAEFVVEWEPSPFGIGGQWMGRLRPPGLSPQLLRYTFKYDQSDASTMLSCDVDFGIPQTASEVQVMIWNPAIRDWTLLTAESKSLPMLPRKPTPGDFANPGGAMGSAAAGLPPLEIESMTSFKLAVAGHSIRVEANRRFKLPSEALVWAYGWLQKAKDSFIIASFVVPGVDTLRAGQTHVLDGIGKRFSGKYYLSQVTHRWDDSGYVCECKGRKVVN